MLGAVFAGALTAYVGYAGTSPIASLDTFNEQREIQQCVGGDSCTLEGMATSLPGLIHGVGWLELRSLLDWLGTGLDGAHLAMQVLNALAVVLVFYLAARLGGGPLAGALAVCILQLGIGPLSVARTELYNSSPLLFFGAVFVLACAAVVERPGAVSVALAALVGAVMANDHLACVPTVVSVVWLALRAPRRRIALALLGAAVFAVATVAVAPPVWLHDLIAVVGHHESIHHTTSGPTLPYNAMWFWAPCAVGAWVLSLASRAPAWVEYRRRMRAPLAVMVPFLAAFLTASRFGIVADAKYLSHVKAACAIAAALPLALIAEPLLRRALSPPGVRRLERVAPFAAALLIAVAAYAGRPDPDARSPTFADLRPVFAILHDQRGWDFPAMLRNVKGPFDISVQTGLRELSAAAGPPERGVADDGTSAVLLVVDTDELPRSHPATWTVVRRSARVAAVLVVMPSRIDWRRFDLRLQPLGAAAQPWLESSLRLDDPNSGINIPHFPPAGPSSNGILRLRLPLRPGGADARDEIFMPRIGDVCGGRIASPSSAGLEVDADGRHASLVGSEPDRRGPSEIEIEWRIGSPECGGWSYDGLPPFFVEGDAADVRLLETILRSRET